MQTITSTKGPLRIPDTWHDGNREECLLEDGTAVLVTKVENIVQDTAWTEYWLDVDQQVPQLLHRTTRFPV